MDVIVLDGVEGFVQDRGGRLWVWLDPHGGLGGPALIYLDAATEAPATTKATRRMRSARRSHRFTSFECPGFRLLCDFGKFEPPAELHLEMKRFPRRMWKRSGTARFVDADLPEEPIRKERS